MPIFSYLCPNNHETELITLSISAEPIPTVPCKHCDLEAVKVEFEQTAPPNLPAGSGGFYKPSQSGPIHNRHDITKLINNRKAGDREH